MLFVVFVVWIGICLGLLVLLLFLLVGMLFGLIGFGINFNDLVGVYVIGFVVFVFVFVEGGFLMNWKDI